MTCIRFRAFLLFFLLQQVRSEEVEPAFRPEGGVIEMGYCFGVDYIVVYRSSPAGDQLLGNSSDENLPHSPPADLQGRIRISKSVSLLGLQITNLTHLDSGIYRRECWQNQTLANQHTQQLYVCNEEGQSEEIIKNEEDGGAEILCKSTSIGLEGTSVRWYYEKYPSYALTLFLDSSVSLEPLVKELQGVVEVRDRGALLVVPNSLLKNNQDFYCLVIKGANCLSFQNMYPTGQGGSMVDIFASQGDRVVLSCPAEGTEQRWDTPLGIINDSSVSNERMYISAGDELEDFSLVITDVSEEHSGDYSCASTSTELQYSLVLCPKNESHVKNVFDGGVVMLECSFDHDGSQRVQWYRSEPSGQHELIHDSQDETAPIPKDLRGRLTVSETGSSLMISDLVNNDGGKYWCVVLKSQPFLKDNDDYKGDYDDEYDTDEFWNDAETCISKQETILTTLVKNYGRGVNFATLPPEIHTTAQPVEAPNITAFAVGGGLVALLLAGVIIAVIVVKRRAKAPPGQEGAASRSGVHNSTDIRMDVDPGCTERLTHNDNA